jgi:hypothetical protein
MIHQHSVTNKARSAKLCNDKPLSGFSLMLNANKACATHHKNDFVSAVTSNNLLYTGEKLTKVRNIDLNNCLASDEMMMHFYRSRKT